MSGISIRDTQSVDDPRLAQVRRIYDAVFPEDGEEGWSWVTGRLGHTGNAPGVEPTAYHVLVAQEEEAVRGFMALSYWLTDRGRTISLGFGDYLGVASEHQGRGIGGLLYRAGLAELEKDAADNGEDLTGMAFDVECPDEALSPANRRLRERRITFYERLGARLLTEVDFWEPALSARPAQRYCPCYHRLGSDIEPRQLVILLFRLNYGWGEDHPLVRLSLRAETAI